MQLLLQASCERGRKNITEVLWLKPEKSRDILNFGFQIIVTDRVTMDTFFISL